MGRTGKPISTGDREKLSEGQCCENTPWTDCLGRQGALEIALGLPPVSPGLTPKKPGPRPPLEPEAHTQRLWVKASLWREHVGTDGVEQAG